MKIRTGNDLHNPKYLLTSDEWIKFPDEKIEVGSDMTSEIRKVQMQNAIFFAMHNNYKIESSKFRALKIILNQPGKNYRLKLTNVSIEQSLLLGYLGKNNSDSNYQFILNNVNCREIIFTKYFNEFDIDQGDYANLEGNIYISNSKIKYSLQINSENESEINISHTSMPRLFIKGNKKTLVKLTNTEIQSLEFEGIKPENIHLNRNGVAGNALTYASIQAYCNTNSQIKK